MKEKSVIAQCIDNSVDVRQKKPQIVSISVNSGVITKMMNTDLGTRLDVGNKIIINSFDEDSEVFWEQNYGTQFCDLLTKHFIEAIISLDLDKGTVAFETRDNNNNTVKGFFNPDAIKPSDMIRCISDGEFKLGFYAYTRVEDKVNFETVLYELADLFEQAGF